MIDSILNSLPLLTTFKDLNIGDRVYSRQYGVGMVRSFYNDEVVVQFSGLRTRLSVQDDISKIPNYPKQNTAIGVVYAGQSMSFKEYKKRNRLEQKRKKIQEKLLAVR